MELALSCRDHDLDCGYQGWFKGSSCAESQGIFSNHSINWLGCGILSSNLWFLFWEFAMLFANFVGFWLVDWDHACQVWEVWWINDCSQWREGGCRSPRAELDCFKFFLFNDLISSFPISLLNFKTLLFVLFP